jgi:hypothetical protein
MSVMIPSIFATAQRRILRWVMILSIVVYQLVCSLIPLVLLTALITSHFYDRALNYDPYDHITLMNQMALLLFGSVVVREVIVVVLWRWANGCWTMSLAKRWNA